MCCKDKKTEADCIVVDWLMGSYPSPGARSYRRIQHVRAHPLDCKGVLDVLLQGHPGGVLGAGATEEKGETARLVSFRCSEGGCKPEYRLTVAGPHFFGATLLPSVTLLLRGALQASFVGAMAIADLVKTTLGPKGMVSMVAVITYAPFPLLSVWPSGERS